MVPGRAVRERLTADRGLDIAATVEDTLERMPGGNLDSLEDVYNLDRTAREIAATLIAPRGHSRVAE